VEQQQKEQLKSFLEAYSRQAGLTPTEPAQVESSKAQLEQGLAGGTEVATPQVVPQEQSREETIGATPIPPTKEVQPPAQPTEAAEEVPEETEEWWQPLQVEQVIADIDDLQFLTNPRQTLQQIVERIDQHYRQQIERIASPLLQSTFALQARMAELEFYVRHPDLIPHANLVNQVAQELLQNPAQVANLTPQQIEAVIVQRVQERLRGSETPPTGVVRGTPPSREPVDPTRARVAETLAALGFGRKQV
jgi:hypothetical protein